METRNLKLAMARKKLKDHQEKKNNGSVFKSMSDVHSSLLINSQENEMLIAVPGDDKKVDMNTINSRDKNLKLQDEVLLNLKANYDIIMQENEEARHKIAAMESEIFTLKGNISELHMSLSVKDSEIVGYKNIVSSVQHEKDNCFDQFELTKTILHSKEQEIQCLTSKTVELENQLETCILKIQQLTGFEEDKKKSFNNNENHDALLQKITYLEQQLTQTQKERSQSKQHYEQYVNDLNDQLKSAIARNERLASDVQNLTERETSLIEQINILEIRIQSFMKREQISSEDPKDSELKLLLEKSQERNAALELELADYCQKLVASHSKVQELEEKVLQKCDHEDISIVKLNADITSDKVAAQKATEQNLKLKQDIQDLEGAYVKMSRDKLELTEKLAAEKFLNQQLTLKLAETEENLKEMQVKLMAKDKEMMRLQTECRDLEKQLLSIEMHKGPTNTEESQHTEAQEEDNGDGVHDGGIGCREECAHSEGNHKVKPEQACAETEVHCAKDNAMLKLQERFLKIMGEVADLSDEKHRLEHIIVQLQNETDIICEYVALYQQQRSLLKKKDEERSVQLKIFQSECELLKKQLNELSEIITKFTEDKELSKYFESNSKRNDIDNILILLKTLRENSIVTSNGQCANFADFYPCACCSGKLIDV